MGENLKNTCNEVLTDIILNESVGKYADNILKIPSPYKGNDEIKLIVLGQLN